MGFQIGKYYEHTCGEMMSIVGEVQTTMYGKALVAECSKSSNLRPVGRDDDAMVNWTEVTKGKWLSNFSREENKPPKFTEDIIVLGVQQPNGIFYTEEACKNFITSLKESGEKLYGYFGLPELSDEKKFKVDMDLVSHEITNLRIEDDILLGDIKILDTPRGQSLWEYMQENEIVFHTQLHGNFAPVGMGLYQSTDLTIIGVHAVAAERGSENVDD